MSKKKNRKERKKEGEEDHLDYCNENRIYWYMSGKKNRDMSNNKRTKNGSLYFTVWMLLYILRIAVSMKKGRQKTEETLREIGKGTANKYSQSES